MTCRRNGRIVRRSSLVLSAVLLPLSAHMAAAADKTAAPVTQFDPFTLTSSAVPATTPNVSIPSSSATAAAADKSKKSKIKPGD
jgi:hypothetical protein